MKAIIIHKEPTLDNVAHARHQLKARLLKGDSPRVELKDDHFIMRFPATDDMVPMIVEWMEYWGYNVKVHYAKEFKEG